MHFLAWVQYRDSTGSSQEVLRIIKHLSMLSHLAIDMSSLWYRSNAQHRHGSVDVELDQRLSIGINKDNNRRRILSKDHFSHAIKTEAQDYDISWAIDMSIIQRHGLIGQTPKSEAYPKMAVWGVRFWGTSQMGSFNGYRPQKGPKMAVLDP